MPEKKESDSRFITKESLKLGNLLAAGAVYHVYNFEGRPNYLIKRVKPHADLAQKLGGVDAVKAKVFEDETLAAKYLGAFIPETHYFNVDFGEGEESVVVQLKSNGIETNLIRSGSLSQEQVARVKASYAQFCSAYRQLRNHGFLIENVVDVDLVTGKIIVYDTNNLRNQETMVRVELLFNLWRDRPASFDAQDVLAFLQKHISNFPTWEKLDEITFLNTFSPKGDLPEILAEQVIKDNFLTEEASEELAWNIKIDLSELLKSVTLFPPHTFKHNLFTLELGRKLGQL